MIKRWQQQPTFIKIRTALQPQEGQPLSGVVKVLDEEGRGFSYVSFPEETVDGIARKMPQGIGPEDQACLKVIKKLDRYEVWCCYVDHEVCRFLWATESPPRWIRIVHRNNIP